jgi:hypothetical protein
VKDMALIGVCESTAVTDLMGGRSLGEGHSPSCKPCIED